MNSGDSYPSKLEDGWLVGRPAGHGFDPAILQDMRPRVVEGKLDNVHAIIVARDVYSFTSSMRRGRIRTA
jgi:hypothetical protein